METSKIITRAEYMADSSNLHHIYYLQFATESTKQFILSSLKVDDIKKAIENGDIHLNRIKYHITTCRTAVVGGGIMPQ